MVSLMTPGSLLFLSFSANTQLLRQGFETDAVNFGTDVPVLEGNHTRYLYGPGSILVAHSDEEYVSVGDLERAVEDYSRLIIHASTGENLASVAKRA
jgi:acetylornithine deacetylase/succinyl-diaminopimelate desuccinylase-like protein